MCSGDSNRRKNFGNTLPNCYRFLIKTSPKGLAIREKYSHTFSEGIFFAIFGTQKGHLGVSREAGKFLEVTFRLQL